MLHYLRLLIISILVVYNSFAFSQKHQSTNEEKWNGRISFDNQFGPFESILYFNFNNANEFTAHSTKNADRRIFGDAKATFARFLNKSPTNGIFITISNGKVIPKEKSDSLIGILNLPMIGSPTVHAVRVNDTIKGIIKDSTTIIGSFFATKSNQIDYFNFPELYNKIIDTTQKYIYNTDLLTSRRWKRFDNKLNKISENAIDDIEFFLGFNIQSQKLPFSHYNLFIFSEKPEFSINNDEKFLEIKKISEQTIYLNIRSFGGSKFEMDSAFNIILKNNFKYLIVDLRNNQGGGLNSAITFGNYLCTENINVGYFITNKWHSENNPFNETLDFSGLSPTTATTTECFIQELKNSKGKKLVIQPGIKTFTGTIFILTSNNTASTCEPIVETLKKNKIATIIGEKTAGAMLSATPIQVSDKYYIFLPIADYYTSDYKRLDQIGVEPDISIDSDKALDFVIENLIN